MRNFLILLNFLLSIALAKILNVGLLCAYNNTDIATLLGWRNVAGAVGVAWDKIQYEKILPDYDNLNLTWKMTECIESLSAGAIIQYVDDNANVVLGPPCSSAAMVSGTVAKYYNFPLFLWGPPFTSELMNVDDYPTIASTAPSTMKLVIAVLKCTNPNLLQVEFCSITIEF